ncbi:MAG: hypothetical protein L3J08_03470 [Flavobacteriaceae bacterium]|nr:hypothetical protein [Flavobacteriaceae bacterium]
MKKRNRTFGLMTMFIIFIFLSGNIIDIPKETNEGSIISAIGTIIIIAAMILITYIYRFFIPK